jgi:hypothetical protein
MGSTLPAASAVIERRNWRRFIATSPCRSKRGALKPVSQASPALSSAGFSAAFS